MNTENALRQSQIRTLLFYFVLVSKFFVEAEPENVN